MTSSLKKQEQARGKALGLLTWTQGVASASFSRTGNCSNPVPTRDIIHDTAFFGWVFLSSGWFLVNLSYPFSSQENKLNPLAGDPVPVRPEDEQVRVGCVGLTSNPAHGLTHWP